ncbi:UPF0223 family protein [Loigolactobacillus iwatensis]|uniref:UPF0223 family protein n=1 Tax=Loigolactobacillus iwatensis TaxID=1267156 RepID=UPI000F7F37AE|nr:UPF0223 family protein [Loigolactobacillus iwatensis]
MKQNYQYPLDDQWTTAEIISVTNFFRQVEDAYEKGTNRTEFLKTYAAFKEIVPAMAEEKRLGREFEAATDYSLYQAVKLARSLQTKRFKMTSK